MQAEILDMTRCELGEGPTYDPAQDKAWWFDILGKRLYEHDFSQRRTSVHELPFLASMLGVVDENTQLVASESGLYLRDAASNRFTLHQPIEADDPSSRSNDGRVHPCGAVWIGMMSKTAEDGAGAIYWFFNGELRKIYPGISIPNAIYFSPDGGTAYFTDTRVGKLMHASVDPETGLPREAPQLFYDHAGQSGGLDGAVVDADGVIWIACWGGACVMAISPEGEVLRSLPVPAWQSSCPAFVGRDLSRLLVTSAWEGMDEAARASDEHAGRTFILDAPMRGVAAPRVVL